MVKIPIKLVKDEETVKQQKDERQPTEQELKSEPIADVKDVRLQEYTQEPSDTSSPQASHELKAETEEMMPEEPVLAEVEDQGTPLKKQLEAKEAEAKEHYEARLRLQAEFDNFKKRKELSPLV